ncbi:GNAT family N-acetyltransferase [Mucilaginibacter sp.]|uniref:GNAT family N-acetyltransferase n=1 Tax=Mucilaginibacter sp. TaxID=1882438 RepID=UPI0025ED7EF4|nr:GNAT family N-acetyltransferase [Mucilaginibacter sp.]
MKNKNKTLDNPVWNALNGLHAGFAVGNDVLKRYHPHILPFVGVNEKTKLPFNDITGILGNDEALLFLGELPEIPVSMKVISRLPCLQMVCSGPLPEVNREEYEIVLLKSENFVEIYEFVNMVQPGYFRKSTPLLGDYYGIRESGQLIAITGQRFKVEGYTEVSAVCTHPEHTGKGLAKYLSTFVCNKIFEGGSTPFQHVSAVNSRAIRLYEFLSFRTRRSIDCWRIGTGAQNGSQVN